jgi:hypothetical protein
VAVDAPAARIGPEEWRAFLSVVDLPALFGPSNPGDTAVCAVNDTPSARTPKRLVQFLDRDHGGGPANEVKNGAGEIVRVQETSSSCVAPRSRKSASSRGTQPTPS